MLVGWGWNGMQSHQMPEVPRVLAEIAKNPDKLLVIVDPRNSETARIANIHLAVRPGTDALLIQPQRSSWHPSAPVCAMQGGNGVILERSGFATRFLLRPQSPCAHLEFFSKNQLR